MGIFLLQERRVEKCVPVGGFGFIHLLGLDDFGKIAVCSGGQAFCILMCEVE